VNQDELISKEQKICVRTLSSFTVYSLENELIKNRSLAKCLAPTCGKDRMDRMHGCEYYMLKKLETYNVYLVSRVVLWKQLGRLIKHVKLARKIL
jgi:hypothetical protein